MSSFRNHFPLLFIAIALNCAAAHCDTSADQPDVTTLVSPFAATTLPVAQALQANSTRAARLIKFLKDPKTLAMKRYRTPPKLRSRADQFAPPVGPPAPQRMSAPYRRAPAPPAYISSRPQLLRRAQNGIVAAPSQRFAYESGKSGRYSGTKGAVAFNAGKSSVYRPHYAGNQPQHPNALAPQTLSPLQQQQAQQLLQLQQSQHYNFKASPPFSGKAIVRPVNEPHDVQYPHYLQPSHQQHHHQPPVQQYPIPPQNAHTVQQYSSAPAAAGAYQQAQQQPAYKPLFHYERAHEEPVLHPHIKHDHGPERPSYAVYENDDLSEAHASHQPSQPSPPASNHNYFVSSTEVAARDAQDYIRFMSSNEYFLPKREPNYRQIDVHKDQQAQYQQHYQQPLQQQPQQQQPQQQQEQKSVIQSHLQYSKSLQSDGFSSSGSGSGSGSAASASSAAAASANYLNTPIQVSQFFYHEDPVPPSSAVVRGSYQAGNNMFVVNSDGNRAVKHIVPSTLPAVQTPTTLATPAVKYPKMHYSNGFGDRTPEPVRFEFTERDAVTSTYTNSPLEHAQHAQQHLRYKAVSVAAPSTPHTPTVGTTLSGTGTGTGNGSGGYGSNAATADDAEDDEDIHEASSNSYGRVPVQQPALGSVSSSQPPPVDQKDNEDYCERICANVQDDDEEIVCGSDGYMYTSEAQMECYASCLRIDVTIQSKGSCSAK